MTHAYSSGEQDSSAPPPDSPIMAVTPDRIAEILAAENVNYQLKSVTLVEGEAPITVVRTGFTNMSMTIAVVNGQLMVEALWRGVAPTSAAADMVFNLNYFNQMNITPTLRFFETEEQNLAIGAIRQTPVRAGMSHNQLGFFILNSIEECARAFSTMEQDNPDLVTWTEDSYGTRR